PSGPGFSACCPWARDRPFGSASFTFRSGSLLVTYAVTVTSSPGRTDSRAVRPICPSLPLAVLPVPLTDSLLSPYVNARCRFDRGFMFSVGQYSTTHESFGASGGSFIACSGLISYGALSLPGQRQMYMR